ncbi:FAD-dependent oxidoreductase [Parafilimonas sp.]|uniref:FAD-dependent oxidoreductase n=1 Tax=Parafilimonas sp. TaxID=1969739 RepID=UPI0039E57B3B
MRRDNACKCFGVRLLCLFFIWISVASFGQNAQVEEFDVVVYGGGSAGFIAAIQAAKLGKKVALAEPSAHVGGMNVEGLGGTDIDNHAEFQNSTAVGGLALEFYRRIAACYHRQAEFEEMIKLKAKRPELWRFEPHIAEAVITKWLQEYPVHLYKNARLKEKGGVVKVRNRIRKICLENNVILGAHIFIDATPEGDLMAAAGVSTTFGRESNAKYNETKNGIQNGTRHAQFAVQVDPYVIPGDPQSGLIVTVQPDSLGTPGTGDENIQAYCFRMCLSRDTSKKIPFSMPQGYKRSDYEIYLRYLRKGGKLYVPVVSIPNGKTDLGAWHDLSHNLYGMNKEYPVASYKRRGEILQEHRRFTQGLFYFLSNDEEVGRLDAALQQEWKQWGLAADEFPDNNGWPRMFYVRDGRRLVSDFVITENYIRKDSRLALPHPVAVAFWPPDLHSVRRIVKNGYAYNEGAIFGGDWWKPFGIPYDAIVPKKEECANLLAPACPSASHVAYGSIRIEFTFMELGQASAVAACLAIDENKNVQDIKYSGLVQQLKAEGAKFSVVN